MKCADRFDQAKWTAVYNQGHNDTRMAEILHCSPQTIRSWRKKNNLSPNHPRSISPEKDAERTKLYQRGMTDAEMGRALGERTSTIWWWREFRGLKRNEKVI